MVCKRQTVHLISADQGSGRLRGLDASVTTNWTAVRCRIRTAPTQINPYISPEDSSERFTEVLHQRSVKRSTATGRWLVAWTTPELARDVGDGLLVRHATPSGCPPGVGCLELLIELGRTNKNKTKVTLRKSRKSHSSRIFRQKAPQKQKNTARLRSGRRSR